MRFVADLVSVMLSVLFIKIFLGIYRDFLAKYLRNSYFSLKAEVKSLSDLKKDLKYKAVQIGSWGILAGILIVYFGYLSFFLLLKPHSSLITFLAGCVSSVFLFCMLAVSWFPTIGNKLPITRINFRAP